MSNGKLMSYMLIALMFILPVYAGGEYLTLQDIDKYTYNNGNYEKYCINSICDITFAVYQRGSNVKNEIQWLVFDAQNKTVPYESVFSPMQIRKHTITTNKNGSITDEWVSTKAADIDADIKLLAVGDYIEYNFKFNIYPKSNTYDLVPVLFYENLKNYTYYEYVKFTSFDPGDLLYYFSFDNSSGSIAGTPLINSGSSTKLFKAYNTGAPDIAYKTTGGLIINGSLGHSYNGNETHWQSLETGVWTFANDSMTFSFFAKDLQLGSHVTIGFGKLLVMASNIPYFEFRQYSNGSLSVKLRDNAGTGEVEAFFKPAGTYNNPNWQLITLRSRYLGSPNLDFDLFIDGVLQDTIHFTVDAAGVFTPQGGCSGGSDNCAIFGTKNSAVVNVIGLVDEIRVYTRDLSAAEIMELNDLSISPAWTEAEQSVDLITNQLYNITYNFTTQSYPLNLSDNSSESLTQLGVGTVNISFQIGTAGAYIVRYNLSDEDSSALLDLTFLVVNPPAFNESVSNDTIYLSPYYNFTLNYTASEGVVVQINNSNFSFTQDNTSQTLNISLNASETGNYSASFNILNSKGNHTIYGEWNAIMLITPANISNTTGNGTVVNVTVDLSGIENRIDIFFIILLIAALVFFAEHTGVPAMGLAAGMGGILFSIERLQNDYTHSSLYIILLIAFITYFYYKIRMVK